MGLFVLIVFCCCLVCVWLVCWLSGCLLVWCVRFGGLLNLFWFVVVDVIGVWLICCLVFAREVGFIVANFVCIDCCVFVFPVLI